jgi:hypothetical protein
MLPATWGRLEEGMTITRVAAVACALLLATSAADRFDLGAQVHSNDNNIAMVDDCTGEWGGPGCNQKSSRGDVSEAEFDALLFSPLITGLVGHPSWRNEPSNLSTARGRTLRVTNQGGRPHTFTRVANFGGGVIPPLSVGMTTAPECAASVRVEPGDTQVVGGLQPGLNRFQCCFHPWMRATVHAE